VKLERAWFAVAMGRERWPIKKIAESADCAKRALDPMMNCSGAVQALQLLKERRLKKTCLVVKAFVKMSGGWKKAFPDKEPACPKFDLFSKTGAWCDEELRMLSGDIVILRKQLGIPTKFRTGNRDCADGVDALCMLLYRLSRSRNYRDLRQTFGGSSHRVGRISNELAVYLYNKFKRKLESLDRDRLNDEYLVSMARAQFSKNQIMRNIIGFIDATVRPCCRPVHFQQDVYNGKDCVHALKFQTVMMADGIIAHLSGPWSGRRHDTYIFQNSELPNALADLPRMPAEDGGELMALYADPGYALSARIFMPYPDGRSDALHAAFNRSMSSNRIAVEWGYGRVRNLFRALNLSTELQIFKSPIAAWYVCAVLFTNCITCIEGGNQVSDYFGCRPPCLKTLLQTAKY
jgi:hypothetical protein